MTHFLDILDHTVEWLEHVLATARRLREGGASGSGGDVLAGQTLAMLFEKPSLRTRVSMEQAMLDLGGRAIVLQQQEVGLGERESAKDVARVLSGMVHGIMARVFEHQKLVDMAEVATVPVINALSDASHPCQALGDALTMQDAFGPELEGRKLAYVGDGNNVARSLARLCGRMGIRFTLAAPSGYAFGPEVFETIRAACPDAQLSWTEDPREAVGDADVIYTDTFISMGQEQEKAQRLKTLAAYQVNEALLEQAPDHVIVLHCLPAYRGVEITDGVMDGPQSRIFPQAHNRLHAQKGLLAVVMGGM